jgi:tetratricopeptide (TPR) repeat protein/outer membrane protein assembly factor BamB/Tfp pilus assembly protein PilF
MHRRYPRNVDWLRYLAEIYHKQNRYAKALEFYEKIEQIQPYYRNRHFVEKLQLALALEDRERVKHLVDGYLHNKVRWDAQVDRALPLLKRHNRYDIAAKILKWAMRYGYSYRRGQYLERLIAVYLKMDKRKQARILLLNEWHKPSLILPAHASIYSIMQQRQKILEQIWPLLSFKQQEELLQHKKSVLLQKLIESPQKSAFKQTLVDIYILFTISRELSVAQQYIPALWDVMSNAYDDRKLQNDIIQNILKRGEYDIFAQLLEKNLQNYPSPEQKVYFMLYVFQLFSGQQFFPPAKMSDFLENQLQNLRPLVSPLLWQYAALQLTDRYLAWSDYQRAINWLTVCQHAKNPPPHPKYSEHLKSNEVQFIVRLARTYQHKGKDQLANQQYRLATERLWAGFVSDPVSVYYRSLLDKLLQVLMRPNIATNPEYFGHVWSMYEKSIEQLRQSRFQLSGQSKPQYVRRYHSRITQQIAQLQRQHDTALKRAEASILDMYRIYDEAGRREDLLKQLEQFGKNGGGKNNKGGKGNKGDKEQRVYYVIAGYLLDWKQHRTPASLEALVGLLRSVIPHNPLPKSRELYLLLAQLETEAAQYDRAIALYRKLVRDQKPKDSVELWRKIAQIYGQLGREQEQVQTHQRLATQLHDHLSDLWLSHYYLERQNIDQAIRHHQSYLKRQARSQYAQLPLAAQTAVQLSEFLLVSGHTDRVFEFLRRALGELRTAPKGNLYQYSHIMQQIMSIALRIGKLQELVAEWEAQRQQNSGDINLLYQLFFAYRLLDQTPNERVVLEELLKLRPNLHQLLQSLLSIYEAESAYQQAIAFLHKLYDKRPQKPNNYYLLLGKLYAQLGQKQQAFASWQKHFESCSSQQSNYEQFACRVDASKTTLESGGIKEALSMYRRAIENYSNLNHWSLVQAVELLNKHQAYREALDFIAVLRGATWPQSPMIINSLDIQLYIAMIRAYRGVQQQDKARQLIQQLRHSDYRDYTTVQRAAALLEEEGFGLSTERVYWSALQKTKPKTWEQRYVYKNLCAYWQRHNLGRMCVGDVDEQQKLIDKQRSLLLAERFEQAGFPYLALIELRKLRLHLPKDPDIWRKLYRLSLQVGHHKEAKQWLEKLRENNRDTKELEQFRKKHEQIAAKAPARPHLPSRKNWPAVAIPGYCQQLKIKSGRLYTANCYNNTSFNIRCERQLLHIGNKLITNDCMGRLLAIDASSGSVNWIYELPRLKHSYEADQKRKAIITAVSSGQIGRPQSFAQFKQNFVSVRRYYQVVDIAATPDGDVLVTINQNWMDHGHRWASGIHEKLHILRIDPSSGQLRWHRKHDGHFAISPAAINGEAFALYGRFYRVFRLQDGQAMWHRQAGKSREIWLFGEKDQLAHIAYHSGFVVMGWDNYLYHYDRKGKLLWRKRQEAQVYAMAIHKQNLLLRNADGQILAIGLKNGDRQWRMDNTGGVQKREIMISQSYPHAYQMISPLLVQADQFFYSSIDGYVSAHSAIDGQSLWRRKIGDHGPYAPVASTCGTKLAFIGEEGTLSLLTTKSGRLLWQYRFPQQIENTVRRRNYRATNSRIQLDAHQIWLGSYDRLPRFVIQAFWFQTQNLQPLVSRLQQLVEQLQREGRSKLAFHAIVNAIDRYDRYFRTQILHIARQIRLPHRQQWLWAYHYLASGQDLQKDLGQLQAHWQKMPLSLNIRDDIQADTDQSRIAIVQLIALITHPNDFRRKEGLNAWQRICVGETPHLMLALADSLSRRFASAMLQHRDPQVRLLAAFSLMMWGDSEGRQTLLEVFTREENFEQAHNKQLRQLGIRNIIGWDAILYWDGLAMTIDAPIIQKLLKSSNAEIRLRSAIFLAMHSAASSKFRKKYDSPLLRQILRQSSIVLNQELAILAAAYLAQLGEGKGIDQLRVLYTQTTGYHKNRIARILYSVFKDLSGLNTILTSYHGNNRINLQLPSFSLIYGNRLQSLKRYDEALYQYQITSKIPKDKIAPAHSVMALLGMGQCLFFLKRYDLARQKFQQALKLEPMLLDALDFLGRIHFELKEYPQAHKLFTRAIQGNPYNSTLRRFAALTLFLLQQPQAAHQLFTQALKDRPEWHSGHYYYAYTLYLAPQTELPLALTHIEQAIKYAAYNPRFLQLKARILYKLKRQTQAHDTLLDAIQKEAPQSPRRKEYIHLYQQWFKRTPPDRQIQGK